MRTPTKLQIETARDLLNKTLREKSKEIAKMAYKKDLVKIAKGMTELNNQAYLLRKKIITTSTKLLKGTKLELDLKTYDSYVMRLPKNQKEINDIQKQVVVRSWGGYTPNMSKEQKEIDDFMLKLVLGLETFSKLEDLVAKIEKI